jgi:hypothetical protein
MAQQLKQDLADGGLLEGPRGFPLFVDTRAAARLLGVSESFLNKARLAGGGPEFAKFGASVKYNVTTLLAWTAARTRTSTSDRDVA